MCSDLPKPHVSGITLGVVVIVVVVVVVVVFKKN